MGPRDYFVSGVDGPRQNRGLDSTAIQDDEQQAATTRKTAGHRCKSVDLLAQGCQTEWFVAYHCGRSDEIFEYIFRICKAFFFCNANNIKIKISQLGFAIFCNHKIKEFFQNTFTISPTIFKKNSK